MFGDENPYHLNKKQIHKGGAGHSDEASTPLQISHYIVSPQEGTLCQPNVIRTVIVTTVKPLIFVFILFYKFLTQIFAAFINLDIFSFAL